MTLRETVIGVSLLLAISGCGGDASEPLPEDLIQVWRNPAPGYEDRYFEIREQWVLFGTSDFTFKMHPIESVQSQHVDKVTKFTIEYRAADGESVPVHLVYTPGSPPHLRIGAREDLWVPEKFASWLKDEDA